MGLGRCTCRESEAMSDFDLLAMVFQCGNRGEPCLLDTCSFGIPSFPGASPTVHGQTWVCTAPPADYGCLVQDLYPLLLGSVVKLGFLSHGAAVRPVA